MKTNLLLAFFYSSFLLAQENSKIIGSKPFCGSSISSFSPAYYDGFSLENSWSSIVYSSENIALEGTINELSFIVDCKSNACDFEVAKNQKVYMKLVDFDRFNSGERPNVSEMTLVYNGDITWKRGDENSWTTINLNTTFEYSRSKNLLVYIENKHSKGLGSMYDFQGCGETPSYLVDNLGENRVIYARFKDDNISNKGTLSNQTPITKLGFGELKNIDYPKGDVNFKIYTNESNLYFKYAFTEDTKVEFRIYDILGREVAFHEPIVSKDTTLYQKKLNLPEGNYILHTSIDAKKYVQKITLY